MSKFLGIEEPDFTATGEALANLIKRRMLNAPGDRWVRTGRLLASIDAVNRNGNVSVVAASDRLQTDRVAEKFAEEILPNDLDDATRKAIEQAVFAAFTVDKP